MLDFIMFDQRTISRTIRFNEGAPLLRLNTMALVGVSGRGKQMCDDERKQVVEAIVSESASVRRPYSGDSGLAFDPESNLVIATG